VLPWGVIVDLHQGLVYLYCILDERKHGLSQRGLEKVHYMLSYIPAGYFNPIDGARDYSDSRHMC